MWFIYNDFFWSIELLILFYIRDKYLLAYQYIIFQVKPFFNHTLHFLDVILLYCLFLQLANNIFVIIKKKELKKVELLAKNREKLTHNIFINFNRSYIRFVANNNLFFQSKEAVLIPTFGIITEVYWLSEFL